MAYGKIIELFLVNGTADSIITAELSNWNGKALKIPRIEVVDCDREDLEKPGVYFLFCKEDDGSDSVYIGESENIKNRLIQHINDYNSEKEDFYWNYAVIFTGRDLTKAHIRYLEDQIVKIARNAKRYKILTKNTYQNTVLNEAQKAVMEEFVDNVKILINTLGYKVLEPVYQVDDEKTSKQEVLEISSRNATALGQVTAEGFVVLKGAQLSEVIAPSLSTGLLELREKMVIDGKIDNLMTKEDILFSSSSAAASFILGYGVSGPAKWKTKDGRTLKEIEENAANN